MHQTAMSSGLIPRAELPAHNRNGGALVETPSTPPFEAERDRAQTIIGRRSDWAAIAILGAFLVYLYGHIAVKLARDWRDLPDFSHGPLIPFFVAFLIWDKRHKLRSLPVVPSWSGLVLVALGLFELLLGVLGADLFLERTSFVLLVAGVTWTLLGRAFVRELKFVLFVFLLATLTLSSSFGLALLIARLLVMLVLASLLENARLLKLLLKPLQSAVKRFVRSHLNLRQKLSPLCNSSTVLSHGR